MAFLIGLSVLLTNLLSYSFLVFGGMIRLAMGNFLLFVSGMLFGPFAGMVSGLLSDTLGTLINNGGVYHFGFAFAKALFGFSGGLVFIFKNNSWLTTKIVLLFSLNFVLYSFMISPLCVASLYDNLTLGALVGVGKLARLPIELAIYLPLTLISAQLLINLLQRQKNPHLWCLRNGRITFRARKTYLCKTNNQAPELGLLVIEEKDSAKIQA